jgi:hypothetical protein
MEKAFPILQFLAREAPGRTGTVQDKVAIWEVHQLVKKMNQRLIFQHHKKTRVARSYNIMRKLYIAVAISTM